jgi:hypothetical protein
VFISGRRSDVAASDEHLAAVSRLAHPDMLIEIEVEAVEPERLRNLAAPTKPRACKGKTGSGADTLIDG